MMNRRTLTLSAAAALATAGLPAAAKTVDYSEGLVQKHLAAGDTVFLDFKASWCGTCRAQGRVINALKSENGAYDQNIVFINVDWDQFGKAALTKSLGVPRRSTLIVLKGDKELGRNVADTSKSSIKALMDTALTAATQS